jgi:hypothetical protein
MLSEAPEIECPECCGNGQTIGPNSGEDIICPHCNGAGWRAATEAEADALAEAAYDRQFEGEPPLSARERDEMQARRDAQWGV